MKYLIANWKMNSVDLDVWEREFINFVSSQKKQLFIAYLFIFFELA